MATELSSSSRVPLQDRSGPTQKLLGRDLKSTIKGVFSIKSIPISTAESFFQGAEK